MGMPVVLEIVDTQATASDIDEILAYFDHIDEVFSPYKETSELERINRNEILPDQYSKEMQNVLDLCEQTTKETDGYFNMHINGKIDPSGIVKGLAIWKAAQMLADKGFHNFYVEIGGDIQVSGHNSKGTPWTVGIQNPSQQDKLAKILALTDKGIATSGTYIRGTHIQNPKNHTPASDIASISVVGKNIYEADRFATAAFAMGEQGIQWLEKKEGLEGCMITKDQRVYVTSGFNQYDHR